MSIDRQGLLNLALRQEFVKIASLGNGIDVYRRQWTPQQTHWRAFRGGEEVASLSVSTVPGSSPSSGHVAGDYSRCQGSDADCRAYTPWRLAVKALPATVGLVDEDTGDEAVGQLDLLTELQSAVA